MGALLPLEKVLTLAHRQVEYLRCKPSAHDPLHKQVLQGRRVLAGKILPHRLKLSGQRLFYEWIGFGHKLGHLSWDSAGKADTLKWGR